MGGNVTKVPEIPGMGCEAEARQLNQIEHRIELLRRGATSRLVKLHSIDPQLNY
jgi:hypothetical protein